MLRFATVCLAVLALAGPALSQELSLDGTWVDETTTRPPPVPQPEGAVTKVGAILIGDMAVTLEATPMQAILDHFGGVRHMAGDAGGAVDWICYTKGREVLWIYMDGEMGEGSPTVIAPDARGGSAPHSGCSDFPAKKMVVDFGIPVIGARADAVTDLYGPNPADAAGRFGYVSRMPLPEGEVSIWQELVIHRTNGIIDAISVNQDTGD